MGSIFGKIVECAFDKTVEFAFDKIRSTLPFAITELGQIEESGLSVFMLELDKGKLWLGNNTESEVLDDMLTFSSV